MTRPLQTEMTEPAGRQTVAADDVLARARRLHQLDAEVVAGQAREVAADRQVGEVDRALKPLRAQRVDDHQIQGDEVTLGVGSATATGRGAAAKLLADRWKDGTIAQEPCSLDGYKVEVKIEQEGITLRVPGDPPLQHALSSEKRSTSQATMGLVQKMHRGLAARTERIADLEADRDAAAREAEQAVRQLQPLEEERAGLEAELGLRAGGEQRGPDRAVAEIAGDGRAGSAAPAAHDRASLVLREATDRRDRAAQRVARLGVDPAGTSGGFVVTRGDVRCTTYEDVSVRIGKFKDWLSRQAPETRHPLCDMNGVRLEGWWRSDNGTPRFMIAVRGASQVGITTYARDDFGPDKVEALHTRVDAAVEEARTAYRDAEATLGRVTPGLEALVELDRAERRLGLLGAAAAARAEHGDKFELVTALGAADDVVSARGLLHASLMRFVGQADVKEQQTRGAERIRGVIGTIRGVGVEVALLKTGEGAGRTERMPYAMAMRLRGLRETRLDLSSMPPHSARTGHEVFEALDEMVASLPSRIMEAEVARDAAVADVTRAHETMTQALEGHEAADQVREPELVGASMGVE